MDLPCISRAAYRILTYTYAFVFSIVSTSILHTMFALDDIFAISLSPSFRSAGSLSFIMTFSYSSVMLQLPAFKCDVAPENLDIY